MPRGIRPTHNSGEMLQGRIIKPILVQEGIERAQLTNMAEFDIRDVIGDGTGAPGDFQDLSRGHVEKFRILIDEPLDQPRASDPIDLRAFTRNPFHDQTPSSEPTCGPAPRS